MTQISAAESQIMEALWRKGPLTPDELVAEVGPSQGWAGNTVRALVGRLLKKGALSGGKEEGRYVYRPLLARADYVQAESQNLLDRLFGGQVAPLVAHLAQHRALTPADVEAIEQLVRELKNEPR